MALLTKNIAELEGGACYVQVRYQDTNELCEYVEWANHLARPVHAVVTKPASGTVLLDTWLQPVPQGQINGSAVLSGADRFKLEEYSISL